MPTDSVGMDTTGKVPVPSATRVTRTFTMDGGYVPKLAGTNINPPKASALVNTLQASAVLPGAQKASPKVVMPVSQPGQLGSRDGTRK